jgi:AcrR family transcriptional regulator
MARPQADDYGEKQQLIRDRAAELFAARGFAGASIADVAAACGCAKSLIYHYFNSKEEILFDLLEAHVQALIAGAERAVSAGGGGAEARFRALVQAHMALYAGARAKHVLLLNELGSLPSVRRTAIVALERRLIDLTSDVLAALVPALRTRPALRVPVAMSFYGMINWTHTWYRPEGALPPEALGDLIADLFLRGLPATIAAQDADAPIAGARGRNESTTIRDGSAPARLTAAAQSSTKDGAPAISTTVPDRSGLSRASTSGTRPRKPRSEAGASRVRVMR